MRKYVAKEDVEKGLVDPHKPLKEQKEYVAKMQKENEKKNQQREPREEKKKRYRENKTQYNWNKRDVTLETPVPEEPKKVLPKPDAAKFQQQLSAHKNLLQELYDKKQHLIAEKRQVNETKSEYKKKGFEHNTKFSGILKQKNNFKIIIENEIKLLEEKRDILNTDLQRIKNRVNYLRKPENLQDCSIQQLKRRLEKTQNKLTTADVDKKQQTNISHRIADIKRAMLKAKNQMDIEMEIARQNDEDRLIFGQLKAIKSDLYQKYKEQKEVKAEIYQIMKQKQSQKSTKVEETRSKEQIKVDLQEQINKITEEREKVKVKLDTLKQTHNKKLDQYYNQQDLIAYIKMVKEQKTFIEEKQKNRKQAEQRKKKQKEQREKERQKQFEARQKKRQERKQREEKKKKQEEEKKDKMKKQRQNFINRNPNYESIEICNYLIDYCELLKPENAQKAEKKEEKVPQMIEEKQISENKEWNKEMKKGAQVIVSKKLLGDEEIPQKNKKKKTKKEKVQENQSGFTHHSDVIARFQRVHVLPPISINEIDEAMGQLKEKLDIFNKPSEEELEAFKAKAEKEFDRIHGFNKENDKKMNYRQKEDEGNENEIVQEVEKKGYRGKKGEKKEIKVNENEFPELN